MELFPAAAAFAAFGVLFLLTGDWIYRLMSNLLGPSLGRGPMFARTKKGH